MYIFFPRGKRCFCFYIYVCVFNESKTKVFFLSHGIFRGIRFPLNTAIQLRFHLCMFCLLISIHSGGDLWACLVVVVVFFGFFFFFLLISHLLVEQISSPRFYTLFTHLSPTQQIFEFLHETVNPVLKNLHQSEITLRESKTENTFLWSEFLTAKVTSLGH